MRARLVRGLGELGAFPEEEKALWQKQLKCALGLEGQCQKEQGSPSGSREWVVSRCMCKRLCTGGIPLLKHLL
jgi:hypothetical protein